MNIEAKIIADSVNNFGIRLTTFQLKYPRFIHAEVMTHRVFSRNASSSRAIPVNKMIEQVLTDPAMPEHWGKNMPGMQAKEELIGYDKDLVINLWKEASEHAVMVAKDMVDAGLHKQIANRILEPFQHIHVVLSATQWDNFYALRDHPDAQPEIQILAQKMKEAHNNSTPVHLDHGEWHIPYILEQEKLDFPLEDLLKFSAARCARVSYLNHDQSTPSPEKDIDLFDKLTKSDPPHLSPVEHQARAVDSTEFFANFQGWVQQRAFLESNLAVG